MIDFQVLDNFAKAHLRFESACTAALIKPQSPNPLSDAALVCGLHQLRQAIVTGSLDEAIAICEKLCPDILKDPHIQMTLRVQKLIELIHAAELIPKDGRPEYEQAVTSALRYSHELAAYAVEASPEAYGMFTDAMTSFADPTESASAKAIDHRRTSLANDLTSLIRMSLGARESCMTFLFRYLLLIYIQFRNPTVKMDMDNFPVDTVVSKLFGYTKRDEEKTSTLAWETLGHRPEKYGTRKEFPEADIQVLPERVNISRQQAIESLRFTDGDVFNALKNELGLVSWNRELFRQLVLEYCAARGLEVFDTSSQASAALHGHQFPQINDSLGRVVIPEGLLSSGSLEMFKVMRQFRVAGLFTQDGEDWNAIKQLQKALQSDSALLQCKVGLFQFLHHLRSHEMKAAYDVCVQQLAPLCENLAEGARLLKDCLTLLVFADDLKAVPEILPHLRDSRVEKADTIKNPLEEGQRENGASTAPSRSEVSCSEDLHGDVRSLSHVLATAFRSTHERSSPESITEEMYSILVHTYGEPELVRLVKELIMAHKEWESESMMPDSFSRLFGINEVCGKGRQGESVLDGSVFKKVEAFGTERGPTFTSHAEAQAQETSRATVDQREQTILTLMEFLALSRAEALAIIRDHPQASNPQAVLDSLLGSMT